MDCRYATLSHRWGNGNMLKLERGNIDTFRRDIPIDQLSKLMKDAMYMTSQLDIEYIWIDCLCIIQGCKRDWEVEAARMGDYYRHSQCNLSATGYEDSSIGLFRERTALPYHHYPIPMDTVVWTGEPRGKIRVDCKGVFVKANKWEFANEIDESALSCRGWVAQERALSPGILHFTPKQMWWECSEHIVNETFPTTGLPWSNYLGPSAVRSINQEISRNQIYYAWHRFVMHYAATDLTFETDRFPAVVGIARIFSSLLHDNFIAGMWERDLTRSLVWSPHGRRARLPKALIAPSWSWAPLALAYDLRDAGCPFDGICFRVLSDDPNFKSDLQSTTFGKSSVRGLAVTGPLRQVAGRLDGLPHWKQFAVNVETYRDVEAQSLYLREDVAGQEWRWEGYTHIFPLWKEHFIDDAIMVSGLLLQRAPAVELQDTFRRIGLFQIVFHSVVTCDRYLGLMKGNGIYQSSIDFEECGLQKFVLI